MFSKRQKCLIFEYRTPQKLLTGLSGRTCIARGRGGRGFVEVQGDEFVGLGVSSDMARKHAAQGHSCKAKSDTEDEREDSEHGRKFGDGDQQIAEVIAFVQPFPALVPRNFRL